MGLHLGPALLYTRLHRYEPGNWGPGLHRADFLEGEADYKQVNKHGKC